MQRRSALLGLCTLAAAPWPAAAQSWPARPLRLVIPFPAGGATDIIGRLLGQKLGAALGQQVMIDNKPGALDLIREIKANPGKYNFGSSGIGTYPHLSAEMFKWRAGGLYVVHIPYRGTGLVVTDLIAGQITFLMDSIVSAQSHIRDGRVRALAVTGAQRSSALPQVPTFAELGVPGLAFSNWFGVFVPAGTPADLVQRLNRDVNNVMAAADMAERLRQLGADPVTGTAEAFAKVVRDEHDSWKAVIQRAGIKAE